jgi:hypothetical protein
MVETTGGESRNGRDPLALAALTLVAALVRRAEKDAERGDQEAAGWLAELRGDHSYRCVAGGLQCDLVERYD